MQDSKIFKVFSGFIVTYIEKCWRPLWTKVKLFCLNWFHQKWFIRHFQKSDTFKNPTLSKNPTFSKSDIFAPGYYVSSFTWKVFKLRILCKVATDHFELCSFKNRFKNCVSSVNQSATVDFINDGLLNSTVSTPAGMKSARVLWYVYMCCLLNRFFFVFV